MPLRERAHTSRGVALTPEPCLPDRLQAIGLPAAPSLDLFPYPAWLFDPTVPRPLRIGFILSCRVSPSEFLRRSSWSPLSGRPILPGFRPSSRLDRRCPLGARVLRPALRSVLRFSQPLDGFRHLPAVRACCIPLPRPGFVPFRGFSRPTAVPGSSPGRAPLPLSSVRSPASRLPRSNASASRPCSAVRCVSRGRGLAFLGVAPLFGFFLLQALARPPRTRFPGSSTHDVFRRGLFPHARCG